MEFYANVIQVEFSIQKLKNYLPNFYNDILPKDLMGKSWQEIDKCSNCIMACGDKPSYSEKNKCCTYYPFIPNFMLGNILHNNKKVAPQILSYIQAKQYVLPIGFCAPESYQFKSRDENNIGFGKDESLLCPFYDRGACNIWDQRNSECISFQCYSSYGETGLKFWQVLGDLIYELELHISKAMMKEHGFPESDINGSIKYINYKQFSKMREDKSTLSTEEWAKHWVNHSEDVAQYFISCYKKSLQLDLKEFALGLPDYIKLNELANTI